MKRFLVVAAILAFGMAHAAPHSFRASTGVHTSERATTVRVRAAPPSRISSDSQPENGWYTPPYFWNGGEGDPFAIHGYVPTDPVHGQLFPLFPTISAALEFYTSNVKEMCDSCKYSITYYPLGVSVGIESEKFAEIVVTDEGSTMEDDFVLATYNQWFDPDKSNGCSSGCTAGDPINLGTGNEYEVQKDYSAGSIQFYRYYNSNSSIATTHIGMQWRDNFDRSITYITDGEVSTATVFRPDGKEVVFQKVNGTWIADPDIHDTLIENEDTNGAITGWTYFVSDTQQLENYNASGLLTSITDLNGQVTRLTYSDASTPASTAPMPGLLITATSPKGRQLQFAYNASSQITQITQPDGGTLRYAYDTAGNMTQVTYPDGHTRGYKYDEASNAPAGYPSFLTGIIDENGQRYVDIHYGASATAGVGAISSQLGGVANLTQVTIPNAYHATVTYPAGAQATIGTTPAPYGRIRISSVSQPCGKACGQTAASRTYDANGNPATSTNFNGVTTAYTYDSAGLETQRIEAQGTPVQRTINTSWDTVFRNPLERTVADAAGTLTEKTDWVYNALGQVVARCEDDPAVPGATNYACATSGTAPAGVRRRVYTYCDTTGGACPLVGLLLSVEDPRGAITQYAYYAATDTSGCGTPGGACHQAGDLETVTDPLGHVTTTVSYDKDGRPTEILDPNGIATTFSYTPRGWLQARSINGATTTIDYDAVGDVTKITQPDGVFTTYGYDAAHRLIRVGDALGNHVDFTLDEAGDRTAENTYAAGSNSASRTLTRAYNTLGELVKSVDAYGNATGYAYDADGDRTDMTDPEGIKTHAAYDALDRLSQTIRDYQGTDAATANTATSFAYDSRDNVSQVTDPAGLATHYAHDGLDDLTELQSPDTGTTQYTYDASGNPTSRTDARGTVTSFTHDALNRLTAVAYPTASLDVQFDYDQANSATGCTSSYPVGHLTEMIDATGNTAYCYDARGNVILKRQTTSGGTYNTTYTWDAANCLLGVGYPDGTTVTYTRDANGDIASVSATPVGGISIALVSTISYLPFGPASQYAFANGGQTLTKLYDANYRTTDIEGSALNLHFKRDAMGDITAEGGTVGASTPSETYSYDALYRLTQVDNAAGQPWQAYSYDETGDRLTKVMNGVETDSYSYAPGTHHLIGITGYDSSTRTVDADGNTTAFQAHGSTYGLTYGDANRLSQVEQDGVITATYGFNGQGERVIKTLPAGGTQVFIYDAAGRLLEEDDSAAIPGRPGLPLCGTGPIHCLAQRAGAQAAPHDFRDYIWAGDTLVAILDNSGPGTASIHYVYTDGLGTPRAVTTESGTLVWAWPYTRNPFGEAPASTGGFSLALGFPGQYYDSEDGLNYNYHRDYEPGTGRYIESDPLGLFGNQWSTFAYVDSQPLTYVDTTGLVHWSGTVVGGGAAAVFGGSGYRFDLTSDCVHHKRGHAIVYAVGPTVGAEVKGTPPISISGSSVSLNDDLSDVDPDVFNGWFVTYSAGISLVAGYGCQATQIGGNGMTLADGIDRGAFSIGCGREYGLDASLQTTAGSATVMESSVEPCDCDQ